MVVGTNILFVKNKALLCIVDYYSKSPVVKETNSLAADDLVKAAMIVFTEYRLPKKDFSCRHELHFR